MKPTRTDAVHEPVVVQVRFQAVKGTDPNTTEVSEHVAEAVRKEGQLFAWGTRPTDCRWHACVSYESLTLWVPAVYYWDAHAHTHTHLDGHAFAGGVRLQFPLLPA